MVNKTSGTNGAKNPFSTIMDDMIQSSSLNKRELYLVDEFSRESCFQLEYYLRRIEQIDDEKRIPVEERQPIKIHIQSYGGYIDDLRGLLSQIEYLKDKGYKIITICDSYAHSCGFILLISGSERWIARYAETLCHQPSSGTYGTLQTQEEQLSETQKSWKFMKKYILEHTAISEKELDDMKERKIDWTFGAEEAKAYNVVDKII